MVIKNYIKQSLKVRKDTLIVKYYKIYNTELLKYKQKNVILFYKVQNNKLFIKINLNAIV